MELEDIVRNTKEMYVSKQTFGLYTQILDREINNLRQDVDFVHEEYTNNKSFNVSLSKLTDVLSVVDSTLQSVAGFFSGEMKRDIENRYKAEENRMEAIRQEAPPVSSTIKESNKEKGDSKSKGTISDLLKTLLKNPLVIAGLVTAAAQLLPEDIKNSFNSFIKGFGITIKDAITNIKNFNGEVALAGAALALLTGPKLIGMALSAITTTLRIIKALGIGKLFKGGLGKLVVGGLAAFGAYKLATSSYGSSEDTSTGDTVTEDNGGGGLTGAEPEGLMGAAGEKPMQFARSVGAMATPMTAPAATTITPKSASPSGPESKPNPFVSDKKLDKKYLKIVPGVNVDGLKPEVKSRLAGMAQEYYEKTGKKIQVNSGFRSFEKQKALYEKLGPGKASRPGTSKHETGLAFDIQSDDAKKLADLGLLEKYGFHRPYNKETWHIEPKEVITNLSGADNPMKPGEPIASVDSTGAAVDVSTGKRLLINGSVPTAPGAMRPDSATGKLSAPGLDIGAMSEANDSSRGSTNTIAPAITNIGSNKMKELADEKYVSPIPSPSAGRGSLGYKTTYSAS